MLVSAKNIIGLGTRTKSGIVLGKVMDLEIDIDKCELVKFIVAKSIIAKSILQEELIIDRSQVIEINEKEIIVDDLVARGASDEYAQA
jgi:sporulation protein YlmC with PRC-barrel domain